MSTIASIDYERAVIGCVLNDEDCLSSITDMLCVDAFTTSQHQCIWRAIMELSNAQRHIDLLSVYEQMQEDKTDNEHTYQYLVELLSEFVTTAYAEQKAEVVRERYKRRQYINLSARIAHQAQDVSVPLCDIQQLAERETLEIGDMATSTSYDDALTATQKLHELVQRNMSLDGTLTGVTSGFDEIDSVTNGWQENQLVIIAARPAMGKTAFAVSMMSEMCINSDIPAALFSLEMNTVELMIRIASNVTGIDSYRIKSGSMSHELNAFDEGLQRIMNSKFYIDDTPGMSVFDIKAKARRMVRKHGVRCIIIDYLQLLSAKGERFSSRQEEVSIISRQLKGLAKELKIPIIALSQLNRSVESREGIDGKRPKLSDLRESGAIEQDADIVCFLHRPEYYKIYTDEENHDLHGKAEFIIAKHRAGALKTILLNFIPEQTKFASQKCELLHDTATPISADDFLNAERTFVQSELAF